MKASIHAISYVVPERSVTNQELSTLFPALSEQEIFKRTGIRNRFVAAKGQIASDLACDAALRLFEEHSIDKSTIDFLIYCTDGPDYKGPATACILQQRLGLSMHCGAIDVPLGCTGFTYSLSVAKGLIESGQAANVLLLTADVPSHVIHPDDIELRMIFGDAGAATLVCASEEGGTGRFAFGTDGSGAVNLMVEKSGSRDPATPEWLEKHKDVGGLPYGQMHMNSLEIFSFAMRVVPPMVNEILDKNGLEMGDIDLFAFHQANAFLLSVLRRKLKIPEEKFLLWMENVGNTVSASIPIVLYEALKSGKARKGDTVLLAAFGIGYSWSGTVIRL